MYNTLSTSWSGGISGHKGRHKDHAFEESIYLEIPPEEPGDDDVFLRTVFAPSSPLKKSEKASQDSFGQTECSVKKYWAEGDGIVVGIFV